MNSLVEQKRQFWNERSSLGDIAGSNDFMLKKIETDFILKNLPTAGRVLDIGCGNGDTLIEAHEKLGVSGIGLDFSPDMVSLSKQRASKYTDSLQFDFADVRDLPKNLGQFDAVYVQRSLINLNSYEEQKDSFEGIMSLVKPGGKFIMVECTFDGQVKTNALRKRLGIPEMEIPWHNLFFHISDIESWQNQERWIESFSHISSTYHFLSRVVYAALGESDGGELKYDSEINKLAISLPQHFGEFGPVKGWVWRKASE